MDADAARRQQLVHEFRYLNECWHSLEAARAHDTALLVQMHELLLRAQSADMASIHSEAPVLLEKLLEDTNSILHLQDRLHAPHDQFRQIKGKLADLGQQLGFW